MAVKRTFLVFLLLLPCMLRAQKPAQLNSSDIKLALKKLNVAGSVLYIAAHPDDENTRLLSYLAKESKLRTGYLSITRGDGGQNLIGNEQAELLGLIRTQELLAARRIDGAEQFFTRAIDFGYSKTPDETFEIWGKEQILADVVWVIRNFRPDVIITRFPEDGRGGHGHHTASAILAREAFTAAADSKRFPNQLKHVQPWQAKRLVWNTFNFGGNNTTADDQLKLNIGVFNPLLGKSYSEIAAESRSSHKSQGFGSSPQRGVLLEYFTPVAGDAPKKDLFEGIDFTWNRIQGGENIGRQISQTEQNYDEDDPAKSVPALIKILQETSKIKDIYWKALKENEVKNLIAACAGLWFEAAAEDPVSAVTEPLKITLRAINNSQVKINMDRKGNTQNSSGQVLKEGNLFTDAETVRPSAISQPYWLAAPKHPVGYYMVKNQQFIGYPENPEPLSYTFVFNINGQKITYTKPVVYQSTDPVRGEVYQPLVIAPPVTATPSDHSIVFSGQKPHAVLVALKSFTANATGNLVAQVPAGWKVSPGTVKFSLPDKGDESTVSFTVTPSASAKTGALTFAVETDGKTYNHGFHTIQYDHIPKQTLFPPAAANLVNPELKIAGKRIGYLAGAGDLVPASLKGVGYDVTLLSENQILGGNLSGYDAIVTGVRAYNVNDRMKILQPKLLQYVENGGTLLVQYNVSNPLKTEDLGPYPFKLSRDRVTEENAAVTFLDADHPVLNYPNQITKKDFEGWVQERGLYFVADQDRRYTTPLQMNDTDETPSNGSLLVANYGKGRYVYTSLSFFRQLPAGVPGAYRLFVNLISKKE